MGLFKRRNRRVRVHLTDRRTALDGVLMGRCDGHYILWCPKVVNEPAPDGQETTITVSGHVEIPAGNVLFLQILG